VILKQSKPFESDEGGKDNALTWVPLFH